MIDFNLVLFLIFISGILVGASVSLFVWILLEENKK